MKTTSEAVKEANKILIVGGGTTGVEAASYLAEKFPHKKIGIIQRAPKLIKEHEGAHEKIVAYLTQQLNISLHLGQSFDEHTLQDLGYDISIDCKGY